MKRFTSTRLFAIVCMIVMGIRADLGRRQYDRYGQSPNHYPWKL